MENIAPDILRQRLLIEAYFTIEVDKEKVEAFLKGLAAHLDLRTYAEPTIFSPESLGKEENQGFDAFIPLIDSGISLYVWCEKQFLSTVLYTCKSFDCDKAVEYTKAYFGVEDKLVWQSF